MNFDGFDLSKSVPVPNFYFDVVANEPLSVSRIVGIVIRHSVRLVGNEIVFQKWEASPLDLMELTGINSRSTLSAALKAAREKGYIHVDRYANGERVLQLRKKGEPVRTERYITPDGEPALGFIYVVEAENGLYKIGKSVNPSGRLCSLQVDSPIDLQMYKTMSTDDMATAELSLHVMFESRRVRGEWFRLGEDDLSFIEELGSFGMGRWLPAVGGAEL